MFRYHQEERIPWIVSKIELYIYLMENTSKIMSKNRNLLFICRERDLGHLQEQIDLDLLYTMLCPIHT